MTPEQTTLLRKLAKSGRLPAKVTAAVHELIELDLIELIGGGFVEITEKGRKALEEPVE